MTGNLDEAIKTLLTTALPALLGSGSSPVALAVLSERFAVDPNSNEGLPSAPRPDDQTDHFAFNPVGIVFDPSDPAYDPVQLPKFTLSKPPYPGPRRVRLLTTGGDRLALRAPEVLWDEVDTRRLTLALLPNRDLTEVNGVEVLYGVTSVFTTLKADQTLTIQLESADAVALEQAEALVIGIVELNRQDLLDSSAASYPGGDYTATVKAKSMKLREGASPATNQRRLVYGVEVELKTTRALRSDEGAPITRIRTTSRPLDPNRPVDVEIGVDG